MREKGSKALSSSPRELDLNGPCWQPRLSIPLSNLVAQNRTYGAIDIDDRQFELDWLASFQSDLASRNDLGHVQRLLKSMILFLQTANAHVRAGLFGLF